jgi:hypothetical protein
MVSVKTVVVIHGKIDERMFIVKVWLLKLVVCMPAPMNSLLID